MTTFKSTTAFGPGGKHPINYLQELMVRKVKPPPVFDVQIITTKSKNINFMCELQVDGIKTLAIGPSKQVAKTEAALKAIELLQERSPDTTCEELDIITEKLREIGSNAVCVQHPVSELQELMAKQKKALPLYEIIDVSSFTSPRFLAKLVVNGIETMAEAPTKAMAKKDVAAKALKMLKDTCDNEMNMTPLSTNLQTHLADYNNPIGYLNQLLLKQHHCTASYQEMGQNEQGEFNISCCALGNKTEGSYVTKKGAKQRAAINMLKVLEDELPVGVDVFCKNENISKVMDDEEVIRKFYQLDITGKMNEAGAKKHVQLNFKDIKPHDSPSTKEALLEAINELNVKYEYGYIQHDPCIMYFRFMDANNTTVMEMRETKEDTLLNLLKAAYQMYKSLY